MSARRATIDFTFRRQFALIAMLSGDVFTALFNLASMAGYAPLSDIHFRNNLLHVAATLTLALILWRRPSFYRSVVIGYAISSFLIFLSALYYMPEDEMRFLWFFLQTAGSFLLIGTLAGWLVVGATIAIVIGSNGAGLIALSGNGIATFTLGLVTAGAFFHAFVSQERRYLQEINASRNALATAALHDSLTGLLNLRAFRELAANALAVAARNETPLSVLFADIDHFKSINDRFGHAGGDQVLTGVARTIQGAIRSSDTVARVGGEEFVVLLSGTGKQAAAAVAEKLRAAIEAARPVMANAPITVTASIGWATSDAPHETLDTLIQRADTAMYAAKTAGRNRVAGSDRAIGARRRETLNASHHHQHDDDQQDEAQATAGAVSPPRAMRPGRQGADENQNEDDHQDCSERHERSP